MKKIAHVTFIVTLFLSLFLSSCSSDDGPTISPIVGAWILDKITISEPPAGY